MFGKLVRDLSSWGENGSKDLNGPQQDKWSRATCIGQIVSKDGAAQPRPAINISIMDLPFTAILDRQASQPFVNARTARCLRPFKPGDSTEIVKGAVYGVTYGVVGQAILRAKCSGETIDILAKIVKDLIPNVILGFNQMWSYYGLHR